VDRVIPYSQNFLKLFPNVRSLANAPTGTVLAAWSGLGYNRRALLLKCAAQTIVTDHRGKFPRDVVSIDALPGVGQYTATAVAAFAFNTPGACIETNIRSVYLHFFFAHHQDVPDKRLLPIIERTVDKKNPREWYYALMDYGAMLKKSVPNPSRRSAHHSRQSKFEGSTRQLRGRIVKALIGARLATPLGLAKILKTSLPNTNTALNSLIKEGMVKKSSSRYSLA
jgi:A/G-specific adenine glycosylase